MRSSVTIWNRSLPSSNARNQGGDFLGVEVVNAVLNLGMKLAALHAAHFEDADTNVRLTRVDGRFRYVAFFKA
jgi:hypothetical protein